MDRRLTPCNGRVAATSLQGQVVAEHFVDGEPAQIAVPVSDLFREPNGARDRQLLIGVDVLVFERRDGWAYVQETLGSYVGYLQTDHLRDPQPSTHRVVAISSHAYSKADMKTADRYWLPFNARLAVSKIQNGFAETPLGYVPEQHIAPLNTQLSLTETARQFLGTPYLWGGNSPRGIDCSGLVQASLWAANIPCPGDSDQQERALDAHNIERDDIRDGDLLFWKGHVAMALDNRQLIHANAHSMSVKIEDIDAAITRIKGSEGKRPSSIKRLNLVDHAD